MNAPSCSLEALNRRLLHEGEAQLLHQSRPGLTVEPKPQRKRARRKRKNPERLCPYCDSDYIEQRPYERDGKETWECMACGRWPGGRFGGMRSRVTSSTRASGSYWMPSR